MEQIGQTKSIYIKTKTEVWGSFTVFQKTNVARKSSPCVSDPGYSYTRCMKEYVSSRAGCLLDWVDAGEGDKV